MAAIACGPSDTPPREGCLLGAEGAEIHYRVLGDGADTAVVVHGGPGAGILSVLPDWEPLAEDLVLIFYDQRGGGRSTLPADTSLLDARYFVEDMEAVRRHFGLERLKLVTHSFGAVLAARYAETYPDRVERMVFHGATAPRRAEAARLAQAPPPSPDPALSDRMNELLGALLRGTAEDPVATCEEYEALGRRLDELRGEPVAWRGTTCAAPPEAVRYYYRYTAQLAPRTFGDWDFTTGLEHLEAPLLVIHGAHDSAALPQQRAWADAVPRGRLLLVEEAGKGAVSDRPEIVLPTVRAFLAGDPVRDDSLSERDVTEIRSILDRYATGWNDEDPQTAIMSLFVDDAVLLPHHGAPQVEGAESIRRHFWPAGLTGFQVDSYDFDVMEIDGAGRLAYSRGRYAIAFSYQEEGERRRFSNEGNYIMIFTMSDDGWKIARYIWNDPLPEEG